MLLFPFYFILVFVECLIATYSKPSLGCLPARKHSITPVSQDRNCVFQRYFASERV
jgi:hypothetical protein